MKPLLLLAGLMGLFLFCGCADSSTAHTDTAQAYVFTDALDSEITVQQPQRVVALMGGLAETWLLAGGELIGVTDDALEERELVLPEGTAVVGKYNNPSVEAIIALNPDLVLLSAETNAQVALQPVLAQADIPSAYFSITYFEDYLQMLKICTDVTGRADLYQQNGLDVQAEIEAVMAGVSQEQASTYLLLITYSGGVAVQNTDSMTGRMLNDLGCENIVDKTPSLLKEFSIERVLTEDPDYIFIVAMGNDEALAARNLEESVESHPAWQGLSAVQNGRYILLPKEQFLYKPNVRWGASYEYLAHLLYGES